MIAYKGTDKFMRCNGFQYAVGKEYKHSGDIELFERGFHACPNPLDVFRYYPPDGYNRFFEVEQSGETITDDKKIVSKKIKIIRELSIKEMFEICASEGTSKDFEHKNTTKYHSHAITSGNCADASTSGNRSFAHTFGHFAHATTTGDDSHASTSGSDSHAYTAGDVSHANTADQHSHANTAGDYSNANTIGKKSNASTSGESSHANTTGFRAHATTSGDMSNASTYGDLSNAMTSGDYSHASTAGKDSIACALGIRAAARAYNGWIVIVDWRYSTKNDWYIHKIYTAKVGQKIKGVTIKPGLYYWFDNGVLKEEQ